MQEIREKRTLTSDERGLVHWLLEHGNEEASRFLPDVENITVHSRCGCGCASINFTDPVRPPGHILSDYQWTDKNGRLNGVFIWECNGVLSGLEVWSIDGQLEIVDNLPKTTNLTPLVTSTNG